MENMSQNKMLRVEILEQNVDNEVDYDYDYDNVDYDQ